MFCFMTAGTRRDFQCNMDTYGRISHIYLLQLCIWLIYFNWQPWPQITINCVIKRTDFVNFITFESIYPKSVLYGPNFKATISYDLCYILGLYFTYSFMWQFSTHFKYGSMLEYVGIISRKDSLDWVDSQMDSNTIYYFEFQNWNLDFHPDNNRCKLTIQILSCSNSITYKTLSWTSSTLKSIQYTN